MKKCLLIVLCVSLFFSLALPAYADIIWEPRKEDNAFFNNHRSECDYEDRLYYVNGSEGEAVFYDAPDGNARYVAGNGKLVRVYYSYKDWAFVINEDLYCTWVPFRDLLLKFDDQEFNETYGLDMSDTPLEWGEFRGDSFLLWEYPGSGSSWDYQSGMLGETQEEITSNLTDFIQGTYTSEEGLVYGYIGYMYGHQNAYICVSDPCNSNLPLHMVEQEWIPAKEGSEGVREVPQKQSMLDFTSPTVLCVAVVATTAALLLVYRKKPTNH